MTVDDKGSGLPLNRPRFCQGRYSTTSWNVPISMYLDHVI